MVLSHLVVRLVLPVTAVLPWLVLYMLAERGHASVRSFAPWLRALGSALLVLSVACYVFDHTRLSAVLSLYGYGMHGASNWLRYRYKLEPPPPTLLNISGHEHASLLR